MIAWRAAAATKNSSGSNEGRKNTRQQWLQRGQQKHKTAMAVTRAAKIKDGNGSKTATVGMCISMNARMLRQRRFYSRPCKLVQLPLYVASKVEQRLKRCGWWGEGRGQQQGFGSRQGEAVSCKGGLDVSARLEVYTAQDATSSDKSKSNPWGIRPPKGVFADKIQKHTCPDFRPTSERSHPTEPKQIGAGSEPDRSRSGAGAEPDRSQSGAGASAVQRSWTKVRTDRCTDAT
eukprot:150322-Chlamydomonas_euryale.AAC.2